MKEDVIYLIDAEDRATKKIRKANDEVKKNVRTVKDLGDRSSASADLVDTLATSLGGAAFGDVAGQVATLSDRFNAFSEVMEGGTKGVMLFKAGMVAAAGVISVQVGQALGDVIWQTQKWTDALEEAQQRAAGISSEISSGYLTRLREQKTAALELLKAENDASKLAEFRASLMAEQSGKERQLNDARRERNRLQDKYFQNTFTKSQIETENQRIATLEAELKAMRQLNIETSKQGREDRAKQERLAKQAELHEKSQNAVRDLLRQEELLMATGEERLKVSLVQKGIRGDDLYQAMAIQRNINRLKDEERLKEEAIARQRREQIDGVRELIKMDKDRLSELKKQETELNRAKGQSTLAGPLTASSSQRLLTGRTGGQFRKTAETIELERQTKIQRALEKNAAEQTAILKRIEEKQDQIEVIGD